MEQEDPCTGGEYLNVRTPTTKRSGSPKGGPLRFMSGGWHSSLSSRAPMASSEARRLAEALMKHRRTHTDAARRRSDGVQACPSPKHAAPATKESIEGGCILSPTVAGPEASGQSIGGGSQITVLRGVIGCTLLSSILIKYSGADPIGRVAFIGGTEQEKVCSVGTETWTQIVPSIAVQFIDTPGIRP